MILLILVSLSLFLLVASTISSEPSVNLITIYFLGKKIRINERYKSYFDNANLYIITYRKDILNHIKRVDSYNKRRNTFDPLKWSYHAYGQAIDINPTEFPYRTAKYPLPQWYNDLALIMKSYYFRWGGDWSSVFDPMHFEIGTRNG